VLESQDKGTVLKDLGFAKMLHCRVRYGLPGRSLERTVGVVRPSFVSPAAKLRRGRFRLALRFKRSLDGAVIGSKEFVNEAFANARERFSKARKEGARSMRGSGSGAKGQLWSVRDLRVGV